MRHHLSAKFVFWRELLDFSKCAFSNQAHHGKVSILPDSYFCNSFEAFNNYVTGNAGSNGTSMNEGSQRSRSQHDCMEFLTFLLDKLHEEVKQDLKRDNVVDCAQQDDGWSTIGKGGSKLIVDEQSRTVAETTAASSVIANMFQGLLR
jgi:ubiquitin C-terminal hydrolase